MVWIIGEAKVISTLMEKQQSFRIGALEKLQSFRKQKSFRMGEKQQSFKERKYKESPGKRGDTELHLAARAGNWISVQRILSDCGGDKLKSLIAKQNMDGETALYVAAEKGFVEVVIEILKVSDVQSAAIKANNSFDAFHIAARQGHLEVVKELLHSSSALAMTTNSLNSTALDTAASQGHVDIVNLLLEETDSRLIKLTRKNGKGVLHSAARMGHVDVVKSLLSKDPSIGMITDRKGQTAFHMAVKGNNVEMVRELLKPDNSIINWEDNKGNTPLHIATRKGNPEVLQLLVTVDGIDINAATKAGETALGIAEKCGNESITAILREAGAVAENKNANPTNPAKQLKQTVSDIKHDVHSQFRQTRQTEIRVQKIKKKLQKLHLGGLNNAINSNTVVAVLIATVAFAAIFTVPGQYVESPKDGFTLGQAYIATNATFIIFLVSDSLALFISLAVVVVQTSLIVADQKAKELMVFVMNKLMWLACLFISVAFISLTYIVVSGKDVWLAWATMAIGASIMLTTLGFMCYWIVDYQMGKRRRITRRISGSRSRSLSMMSMESDPELLKSESKMYAL